MKLFPSAIKSSVLASLVGALMLSPALVGEAGATGPTVNIVGYSVAGVGIKALEAAFQATPAGAGVIFHNTFGASDTMTNNVANGQAADFVNFSYTPNLTTLVAAGKVPANWASQELTLGGINVNLTGKRQQAVYNTPGILTDSTVVFVVRQGNPLKIKNWADLIKHGVQIVTPNPASSGSARWNLLAAYTAQIALNKTKHQAIDYLKKLLSNVVAQPTSGSLSMSAFVAGTGNVLLAYEDDAKVSIAAGNNIQFITPPQTMLIENPAALTNTGLTNPAAVAFYKYAFSADGQAILASQGYRPVLKSVATQTAAIFTSFKKANSLLRVTDINKNGWASANLQFFSPTVTFPAGTTTYPKFGIVTYLEQFVGSNG